MGSLTPWIVAAAFALVVLIVVAWAFTSKSTGGDTSNDDDFTKDIAESEEAREIAKERQRKRNKEKYQ